MILLRAALFLLFWPVRTMWRFGTMPVRLVFRLAAVGAGIVLIFTGTGLAVLSGRPGIPLVSYGFALLKGSVT